jgi:hypothetical protein
MMPSRDAATDLNRIARTIARLEHEMAEFSRSLAPVLRDAGRMHSAAALEELLFQLDAAHGEMKQYAADHPEDFIPWVAGLPR